MTVSLSQIETVLREEDIESLIASGAPSDEYADEAKKIYLALTSLNNKETNKNSVVAVISLVWAKAFNRSAEEIKQRLPAFQRIAQKLL